MRTQRPRSSRTPLCVVLLTSIPVIVLLGSNVCLAGPLDLSSQDPDRQQKGAIGAGLLTGGATLLGTPLLGAFAAGFQIGYGTGMIVKSVASHHVPDPNFNQPVQVATLTINPLPNPSGVGPAIANPANAAMQDIGIFDANIRALGIADNRYLSALAAGNLSAASSQLTTATGFFNTAQGSLFHVSSDLGQLQSALSSNPDGHVIFNVSSIYPAFQSSLISTGFPPGEQTYINQYQMSATEQSLFISTIASLSTSDAVGSYGSTPTFQSLIGQLSSNSGDIAQNLAAESGFVPEPSALTLFFMGILGLLGYSRLRRKRARENGRAVPVLRVSL
jgi:hypothetical protein